MPFAKLLRAIPLIASLAMTTDAFASQIWLAPPGVELQTAGRDDVVNHLQDWRKAAAETKVLSITFNTLIRLSSDQIAKLLLFVKENRMQLNVTLLALPVDKTKCGNGIEGTVWPREPEAHIKKLQSLGVAPDYFQFDGPFIAGHYYRGKQECRLSIRETASHLAITVKAIRSAFPKAMLVEAESPNYVAPDEWYRGLQEWLSEYKAATGEALGGMSLDIVWNRPWHDAFRRSVAILRDNGVKVGFFLNAPGRPDAQQWIEAAKTNGCDVLSTKVPIDYVIVSNWFSKIVPTLPEGEPSLTSLVNWFATDPRCAGR